MSRGCANVESASHVLTPRDRGNWEPTEFALEGEGKVQLPVVCTLTPAAIAARKAALLPGLVGRAASREETATGIRLRLPADALSAVLETVDAERHCCRFLRFDITVEPDDGPIWLELAGPPGTRDFLSALLDS